MHASVSFAAYKKCYYSTQRWSTLMLFTILRSHDQLYISHSITLLFLNTVDFEINDLMRLETVFCLLYSRH